MAKKVYPVRLDDETKQKLEQIAKRERRKASDYVRLIIEDAVAAYEKEHGTIQLPPPSSIV